MQDQQFGKIRSILWPVHAFELKKLLPMLGLFFFISFNYTLVRNIKDSLIVHAPGAGAETFPMLKFFGVIPAAIIFMLIYAKLSNILSKPNLFYVTVMSFLAFFIIFDLVLYPMQDAIHPHAYAEALQNTYPKIHYFIAMFRNWSFSLFYIFAELWGSVVLSLLFWGFANDTTKVEESKRFYALFGIGANIALDVAGRITSQYGKVRSDLPEGVDPLQYSLDALTIFFTISALSIVLLYWWINKYVLTDTRFYDPSKIKKKSEKPKMSLKESFKFLIHSRYLLFIALLVICYGISINVIEVTWKQQLGLQFPTKNEYLEFYGRYNICVAWTTIFMMLFVTGNVLRVFGWRVAALITPTVLLVTGIIFFALIIFMDAAAPIVSFFGTTPLYLAVIVGLIQNVMSKSSKYSLFDPTKEMTYIPLDQESKVKGKAAIDVVGSRLGKAGGSVIQIAMILYFGSLAVATPAIAIVLFVIIAVWIVAAFRLSKAFAAKNESNPDAY